MTTITGLPESLEEALREDTDTAGLVDREDTDVAGLDREYAVAVAELVEDARAEARAAGRQLRVIHRMWRLQEQAHEQHRAARVRAANERARGLGQYAPEPAKRTVLDVADEIGPALRLPAGTAVRRVETAVLLAEFLPRVLQALESGAIALRQAEVIVDLWRDVGGEAGRPPEQWTSGEAVARVVDELLEKAPAATAAQLRALARRRLAWLLAGSEEDRHRVAHQGRRVWIEPEEDGMALLCALLDAATAHAVHDRLTSIAARVDPHGPPPEVPRCVHDGEGAAKGLCQDGGQGCWEGGPRTAAQLRADVLASLLLDGEPALMPEHLRGIRGQVTVTVPVLALLGRSSRTPGNALPGGSAHADEVPTRSSRTGEAPTGSSNIGEAPTGSWSTGEVLGGERPTASSGCAELAGYGPIPVSVAERIAAGAGSWARVLTHPVTGTVLDHDRTTYAVPSDLKRRMRARDGTCRFPGCRRRAERCDLDHTVAWAEGGETAADNLAHLCRHHHVLKHRHGPLGRWQVRHRRTGRPEGVLEWTSPAGRVHVTYPQQHHHPVLSRLRIADGLPIDTVSPPAQPASASSPLEDPWPSRGPVPHGLELRDDPPPF